MENAENIARLVTDLRRRRLAQLPIRWDEPWLFRSLAGIDAAVVIDGTALAFDGTKVAPGEMNVAPPFDECVVGLAVGAFTSAWLISATAEPPDGDYRWHLDLARFQSTSGGGVSDGSRAAVKVDQVGRPSRWKFAPGLPESSGDAVWAVLRCFDFLNCANVELIEPQRSRAEQRRLGRFGVTVKTLAVYPGGSRKSGHASGMPYGAMPLTNVRGHYSHFGNCCPGIHEPKGLAFGRLTGRFWVPSFARGDEANGSVVKTYELRQRANSQQRN